MLLPISLIIFSLVVLYFAANWLVLGGSSLAKRLGVSPLIIGLTVVSFGTSAPELVVSVQASLAGQGALSIGNVVGSNFFNIGVILGISALIYPLLVKRQLFKLDVPVMIGATVLFLITFYDGKLTTFEAVIYLVLFVVYMIFLTIMSLRKESPGADDVDTFKLTKHWAIDILFIVLGLGGLIFGSDLLVNNSVMVATRLGMSEALVGLTIVAAGTSMPELATSVVAAMKKNSDIAIGNVVGSSVFNILLIMGVAGTIKPIETADINMIDGLYLLAFTLLLFVFMRLRRNINRVEGALLFVIYLIYFFYKLFF